MKADLKRIGVCLVFAVFVDLLIGCSGNPTGPGGLAWTQGGGLQGSNVECGFGASGGNLLTSTYCSLCSQAYIWLSTDEGSTWKLDAALQVDNHSDNGQITNGLYLPAPLKFVTDGTTLLAGIGYVYEGAIYRSTDNGLTWFNSGVRWSENDSNREDIYSFCLLGVNIFAGTDDGVFRSTDEGTSWNAVNIGIPEIYTGHRPTVTSLATMGSMLFATTSDFGIYRSTNAGDSWSVVNTNDYNFVGLAVVGSEIFAAAFNAIGRPWTGGVFVSSDNGKTWQHADNDLPDHGVGAICAGGSYLFAAEDTAIFASNDCGATWRNISLGVPLGGATTVLWTNGNYLYSNSGGEVWRYPLVLLRNIGSDKEICGPPK